MLKLTTAQGRQAHLVLLALRKTDSARDAHAFFRQTQPMRSFTQHSEVSLEA